MLYIQDFTVFVGEVCEKSITITNNRQVAQNLSAYDSLALTIEHKGATRTVLQSITDESSSEGDLNRELDAIGVLSFRLDAAVTAAGNTDKVLRLAVRESTTKELVAACNVTVSYAPGA